MVDDPSHVKQLSLNHVCKIGLRWPELGQKITLAIHAVTTESKIYFNCKENYITQHAAFQC